MKFWVCEIVSILDDYLRRNELLRGLIMQHTHFNKILDGIAITSELNLHNLAYIS